jgi:hypothetical protein
MKGYEMTQDEIIKIARQAEIGVFRHGIVDCSLKELEAFAKLVAAKEREACAKYVEGLMVGNQPLTVVMGAIGDGIRARGEA